MAGQTWFLLIYLGKGFYLLVLRWHIERKQIRENCFWISDAFLIIRIIMQYWALTIISK